ncbi:hypothetical protein CPB84DRAFT_1777204 [Gymnopilus junonius]|uniref:Uncharacterized protein n=1 Tax=Gymnopilus junonius TaxID=109634 RepID=A0A9P5TNK6_GYMJU|nr:hypothetical protein CPB84DRAFT_1777204 [Gymnopilus junonius]
MFLSRVSTFGRIVTSNLYRREALRPSNKARYLSSTPLRRASESPQPQLDPQALEALRNSEIYQKLSQNPDAIKAIQKLSELMISLGVQATPGKPPSMLQMSKLLMNSEFREASQNAVEQFKKAGIDPADKATIDQISSLMSIFNVKK